MLTTLVLAACLFGGPEAIAFDAPDPPEADRIAALEARVAALEARLLPAVAAPDPVAESTALVCVGGVCYPAATYSAPQVPAMDCSSGVCRPVGSVQRRGLFGRRR